MFCKFFVCTPQRDDLRRGITSIKPKVIANTVNTCSLVGARLGLNFAFENTHRGQLSAFRSWNCVFDRCVVMRLAEIECASMGLMKLGAFIQWKCRNMTTLHLSPIKSLTPSTCTTGDSQLSVDFFVLTSQHALQPIVFTFFALPCASQPTNPETVTQEAKDTVTDENAGADTSLER